MELGRPTDDNEEPSANAESCDCKYHDFTSVAPKGLHKSNEIAPNIVL
jgi:hypothetical protein